MDIPTKRLSSILAFGFGILGLGLGWFGTVFGALGGFVLGELFRRLWTPFQFGRIYSNPDRIASLSLVEACLGAGALGFIPNPPTDTQISEFSTFLAQRDLNSYTDDVLEKYFGLSQDRLLGLARNPCFRSSADLERLELLCTLYRLGANSPKGTDPLFFQAMVALGEVWGIAPQRVQGLFLSGRWYPSYEALAILGLNPGVDFAQVKKRYRELVSSYHPDTRLHHIQESPDPDAEFVRVQEAYQELERQARLPLDW